MRTVLVELVLVTSLLAPATVAANEAPLADAGLDQRVPAGTTVYLDATGSRDPDGSVVGYEWVIEAANAQADGNPARADRLEGRARELFRSVQERCFTGETTPE